MIRQSMTALALIALAGCSQGDSGGATDGPPAAVEAAAAPAAAAPAGATSPEKLAILAALPAPWNQADLDNGRRVFARCRSCHTITEGGPTMTGPNLYGLFGRQAGTQAGFSYSDALKNASIVWDGEQLDHWLENPRTFLTGTKMSFAGIPNATDRRDVIAFLKVETGYTQP